MTERYPTLSIADADKRPLVDAARRAELEAALEAKTFRDLVKLFVVDTQKHIDQIMRCAAQDDLGRMGESAHELIGTAGNVGATRLNVLARLLSEACKDRRSAEAKKIAEALSVASFATIAALKP